MNSSKSRDAIQPSRFQAIVAGQLLAKAAASASVLRRREPGEPLGQRRRPPMSTTESALSPSDLEELIETRRDLHAHPELAFNEVRTSGIVAERLRALGLEARTGVGRTGVLATVKGGRT